MLTGERTPVQGITFMLDRDKDQFTVGFVGISVLFRFRMENMQGCVSYEIKDPVPGKENIPIGSFTFDGEKKTNLKEAESDEPIYMNTENACGNIVLNLLYEALQK